MNYCKHYSALISKARSRAKPEGYAERHHVTPVSLGGSDEKENLVWLTAREHFLAHFLLAKIHGGSQWYSVMIFKAGERRIVNSRLYETAKVKHANWMSVKFKGSKLEQATKLKISKSLIGNTNTLGSTLSAEHKTKISSSLIGNTFCVGRKASEHTKALMSAAHSGKKRSEETKARIRAGVLAANLSKQTPTPKEKLNG